MLGQSLFPMVGCRLLWVALAVTVADGFVSVRAEGTRGRDLYTKACAACHGANGKGASSSQVGFPEPLPDFTDCRFGNREPDSDWMAVSHGGGPARGFARIMPAFGEALTVDELQSVVDYVRTFCTDSRWPRGELNLPRPLVTEKAFPEDELVVTTVVDLEGEGSVANRVVYEKRFGATNQVEFVVPFGWSQQSEGSSGSGNWRGGLGDLAIGLKRALYHSFPRGSILSVTGEVILPTGDSEKGLGKGTGVFEPFVTYGQILPADSFIQFQGGFEFPFEQDEANNEAFWRVVLGKSYSYPRWGRTWSPMLELLAARELESGEKTHWDLLPEVQVTLSRRQHVMLNFGFRFPLNDADTRDSQFLIYLLWDWFDGGFLEAW